MSYDLTIYLAKAAEPDPPVFGPGALCNVEGPLRIEPEDIPDQHMPAVGKRRFIWQINLEGSPSASDSASFAKWMSTILAAHNAVMIDEQLEIYRTRRIEGPLANTPEPEKDEFGSMSFFFEDADAFHPDGLQPFLDALKTHLPQAMPTRYGAYEPMQGRVEDGDLSDLITEWRKEPGLLMRAKTPFGGIFVSLPCRAELATWHPDHWLRSANLVGRIEFDIRPKLFSDARLREAATDFMVRAAALTGAFYAELRREECPVRAWAWRGLPPGPVDARVIGPPYVDLWPECATAGEPLRDGRVLLRRRFGGPPVPDPPQCLTMPLKTATLDRRASSEFAEVFPFPIGVKRQ